MNYLEILVFLFGVLSPRLAHCGSWNLGCYYGNQTALSDGVSVRVKPFSVVGCGEACGSYGYGYMGLNSGDRCSCYNMTTLQYLQDQGLQQILPEYCNISCNSSGDVPLPCGGEWTREHRYEFMTPPMSLYLTAGPYLVSVTLEVDADWVVVNTPLAVEAVATLAKYINTSADWANTSKSGLELSFNWDIEGSTQTDTDTALGRKLRSRIPYTFSEIGNHTIEVEVRNAISSVTGRIDLTVINPEPKNLQLALLTGEEYRPSCTPRKCNIRPGTATVAVFSNYSTSIEASVSVGENLTFELEYSDDNSYYVHHPNEDSPSCRERNCTSVIQNHVFRQTGVYNVTVTVSNQFGSIQETMTVVVVNHKLSNLSLSVSPDSSRLVTPRQPVTFILKVETASRQDTTLELMIGNNRTRVFTFQEFNASALLLSEPDRASIVASYGVGCTLEIAVDHLFKMEGVYRPVLVVYNNVSSLTAASSDEITVLNKLAGPMLHVDSIVSINTPTTFYLGFDVKSKNMTITWQIFTQNAELVDKAVQTDSQSWSYTFRSRGRYIVSVLALNLLGNVSTGATVYVQEPIAGVTLTGPDEFFGAIGTTLKCDVRVQSGSDISFIWNFSDDNKNTDVISKDMSSQANHTFLRPGKYNISVTAVNNVSQEVVYFQKLFVVQRKVTFVVLQSTEPTVLGNGTIFLSMIDKGTDVKFDFDFGSGRRPGNGTFKTPFKYFVTHTFERAAIHVVKVYAYNLVSAVVSQIDVIVEEPVPEFTIQAVGPIIVNRTVVLTAMNGGDVLQRPDLIFRWAISHEEQPRSKTRSPIVMLSLPEEGQYNVSVEVGNRLEPIVGVSRSELSVTVLPDEGQLSLHHCGVAQEGRPCNFKLQGNTSEVIDVTVEFQNQFSEPQQKTVNPNGWSFAFEQTGLHRVFVRGRRRDNDQQLDLSSFFIVEKVIQSLNLQGPQVVALQSLPRRYVWTAILGQGYSHVIYVWTLGNNRSLPTTYREYTQHFTERGTYVLFLEVLNDVSRVSANMTIVAQHPIVDASLSVRAVVLGVATNIRLEIEGGREFLIHINCGDDHEYLLSSEDKSLSIQTVYPEMSEVTIPVPEHHVNIPHIYGSIGEYNIHVNVSNKLSWTNLTKLARVEVPVTGIVIELISPSAQSIDGTVVVEVGTTVEVRVSVETGNDLSFTWSFSDQRDSKVESEVNFSIASHTFTYDGTFQVTVSMINPYMSSPIVKSLPIDLNVVKRIEDIDFMIDGDAKLRLHNGNWTTGNIKFSAWCLECSHVTFKFDFGDGSSESIYGIEELQSLISGEVYHKYTKVGIYVIQATAINALNNMTGREKLLYVQVPPLGLQLDQSKYKTRFGNDTQFIASISQGTNVTFNWRFGDDQEMLDAGPNVTHRYLNRGNFTVSVIARNKVSAQEAVRRVYVQYVIQGVDLRVNKTLIASGETVEFTAHPYPQEYMGDQDFVVYYLWKLDQTMSVDPTTSCNKKEHTYKFARKNATRVVATVVAANDISNATSPPLHLSILAKVELLQMHYTGDPLVNSTLKFDMSTYSGSELNFTWNFGDGTPVISGYDQTINHTFTRHGEYEVVGYVENALSNATVKKRVFILDAICLPPEISILPYLPGVQAQFSVDRSKQVKIEVEIKVNCSLTHSLEYAWTIRDQESGDIVQPVDIPQRVFEERNLYFPAKALQYGNYTVQLTVRMNRTIVYNQVDMDLEITPSSLNSVIKGGILRKVNLKEMIVLDGSLSNDPDILNATDMSYSWSCFSLKDKSNSCFAGNYSYIMETNQSIVEFPGRWLKTNTSGEQFAFNLTVSKPGRKPHTSTQILRLSDSDSLKSLHIRIECPSCVNGLVNRNQRLALKAICENCYGNEDIFYSWKVEMISRDEIDDDDDGGDGAGDKCEQSAPNLIVLRKSLKAAVPTPREEQDTTLPTTTTSAPQTVKVKSVIPGLFVPEESPSKGRSTSGRKRRESSDSGQSIPLPQPGGSSRRSNRPYSRQEYNPNGSPISDPSDTAANIPENAQFVNAVNEGPPGDSGSAAGRNGFPDIPEHIPPQERPNPSGQHPDNPPPGEPLVDAVIPNKRVSYTPIVEKSRNPLIIPETDLKTGYHSNVFVIKPDVLLKGREYIFAVEVVLKGDPLVKGESWMLIRVNSSPSRGICTVPNNQTDSYELEEMFSVYCKEWQDDNDGPLSYEVSYRLSRDQNEPFNLIYGGLNTKVDFRLPAGRAPEHLVFVRILISDIFGASTRACDIALKVLPRELSYGNDTVEQQLYNEVSRNDSILGVFISQKDYSNTRVFVTYLTLTLNRLGPSPSGVQDLRKDVRHTLLTLLNEFPIRDEYELMQTLQPAVQLTHTISELDWKGVNQAIKLLNQISHQAKVIFRGRDNARSDLLHYILQASTNIMAASTQVETRTFAETPTARPTKAKEDTISLDEITSVIDSVLMLESRYIGEEAVKWSSDYISVFANRYGSMEGPVIEMGEVKCQLPKDMAAALNRPYPTADTSFRKDNHLTGDAQFQEDCYEAHIITIHDSPILLHSNKITDNEVQSKLTSLKLMDCEGQEVKIGNLSKDNMVEISIPQKEPQVNSLDRQTLRKWQMNIHEFNITEKNFNESMHIQIDFQPVQSGRLFPVTVLIRCEETPLPDEYLYKTEFGPDQLTLPLYLPAGTFNSTGTCFLALVDSSYDAGRPRPTDVRERDYELKTWWGQCLFWDTVSLSWSGKGCQTTANSTINTTVCLCNHLTIFASRLDLVPNDLHFTNVEDFFDLNRSPVMFAWITAVFLMYFTAMIICRRLDLHDARKGGVVYLQDNAVTDHQKYEITLETGFRKGAGTSAKISVILHGEDGMSETRELISEDNRPLFERNSRDTFIMSLPNNIGRIWKVQLWHNNSGASPSWYLSRVIIKDLSCERIFYFICEKWLAVEEDDGKVEGEFMSLEGNVGFKTIFWAKGTQYAIDFHLWASLFTCPSYSNFSRVQRLTVCLSLVMSYMCLNAVWYKDKITQYRGEFGLLDLSWRSVAVGAICCAIIIPVHLFLVFLFRRSKAPKRRRSREDVYRLDKCEHLEELDEEPIQPVNTTTSILDQSLLNWQNIQEWAQKQWVKRHQSEVSSSDSIKPNTPQIEVTKKSGTLEQASSGFEDCASQDRIQPTLQMKKFSTVDEASDHSDITGHSTSSRSSGERHACYLPSCCVYLAWILSVIIIVGCAVITMLYGFRFGKTKSTMWLQSFYFSFMVCVFITQPFMILIFTLYTAIKYRKDPSIFDYRHGTVRRDACGNHGPKKDCILCEECEELARGVAARQRSRYLRFARPPQEKHLIEARKKIMKEKKAYSALQDYWQFVLFFVVLATMAYGKDLSSPFYVNEYLKNSLVRSGHMSFTGVKSVRDWWSWAGSGLLDGLFNHASYDRNNISSTQSVNLYIIGNVHLRQLRVSSGDGCPSIKHPTLKGACHEPYSSSIRAEAPFGPNGTWIHTVYPQYYKVRGRHAIYESTGYVVQIAKTRARAIEQLSELRTLNWVDTHTRAVIVEFAVFYAPASLFTSVTLLLETPPTGGAFPNPTITSTYLYRYITVADNMVLAAELFFMVLVLYSMKSIIVGMVSVQYNKYISNPWNILEVVFCLTSLAYMGCYIYRFVLVYDTKEYLLSTYYEMFVDISTLSHWDEVLKALVGFLLALVICKFLYLLRYKRTFSNLGNFYKRAYRELFVFSAMFVVFLLAFTSLGYAAFGVFSSNFTDFWTSLGTMAGLLVGCHNFPEFEMYNLIGAKLFIFSYIIVVTATLMGYVVAVLSYQYKIYRQGEMIAMGCSDTIKFFWERFLMWAGIKRPLPPPEPDSELPPEFTMAEIEYQVEELLFRLNAISGSSNLPEKLPCYFTDSDVTYGVGDDGISSGEGSENRGFDEERFEQRIHKIEENLYYQEPYLAQLIKLDSIGVDMLSQEREKQLRSHLELEIFRRLQMQREHRLRSSDRSSSSGGSLSLPPNMSSRHDLPTGGVTNRKSSSLYPRLLKPVARSESSLVRAYEESISDRPNLQTILAPNEYILPDRMQDNNSSLQDAGGDFPQDLIREALSRDFGLAELEVPKPRSNHKPVEKVKSETGSSSSSGSNESNPGPRGDAATITNSGDYSQVTGAGARAKVKHGGQGTVKPVTTSPKVFNNPSLRELPPIEVTKTSIIGSPGSGKRKGAPATFSLLKPNRSTRSGIITESSSGSEQDAYRGRRPAAKARTLRKTKSRGKGKGARRLPTLDSLEDDLWFGNDGYITDIFCETSSTSESSKDKSSSSSDNKQPWV